ncbi:hypothetical protein Ciccas_013103 [Cichlidogyrus casuarinus]|uniref:Uncharacterized protein n=1 Tax=Cichlidogyrus casuarinus TaxID=1844966 RepID=A0ABD2PMU5_9PLAT
MDESDRKKNSCVRHHLQNLLNLMHRIYRCSVDFEQRPGLRMLIQQVFNLSLPATLHPLMIQSLESICCGLISLCRENIQRFQAHEQVILVACNQVRENFLRISLLDSPSGGALKRILEFDFFQSDMPPEFFCAWITQLWPLSTEKDLYPSKKFISTEDASTSKDAKDPVFLYPVLLYSVFLRLTQMYLFLLSSLKENNKTLAESVAVKGNTSADEEESVMKKVQLVAYKRQKQASQMPPPGKNGPSAQSICTKIGVPQQSHLIAIRKLGFASVLEKSINAMLQHGEDPSTSNFFGLMLGTPLSNLVACTDDENLKTSLANWFASLAATQSSPK